MKKFLTMLSLLVFCLAALAGQCCAAEIKGYPITEQSEEELASFLEYHKWEVLPVDTEKVASIDDFAAADESLCAIAVDNEIFVYEEATIVACYHYDTPGTFKLLFDGKQLVIYEVRGSYLLFMNLDTGAMSLYDLEEDKVSLELQSKFVYFGDTQRDATVDGNGYYVTNHWRWMDSFTNSHEKLIFVQNGQETLLHESYTHLIWIGLFTTASLMAGLLFLFKFREHRQNKRKQETAQQ